MNNAEFINSYGAFKLRWLKKLVSLNFEEKQYPEEIRKEIFSKVVDYYLDRCTVYDQEHKSFASIIYAYDDAKEYIKFIKQEKKNIEKMLKQFSNADYEEDE